MIKGANFVFLLKAIKIVGTDFLYRLGCMTWYWMVTVNLITNLSAAAASGLLLGPVLLFDRPFSLIICLSASFSLSSSIEIPLFERTYQVYCI